MLDGFNTEEECSLCRILANLLLAACMQLPARRLQC